MTDSGEEQERPALGPDRRPDGSSPPPASAAAAAAKPSPARVAATAPQRESLDRRRGRPTAAQMAPPDEPILHHGGSFGTYFAEKIRRLQEKNEHVMSKISESSIFQGCYIFVNGATHLPIEELRRLVAAHGGIAENYQVARTTHFVCNNFTDTQLRTIRNRKVRVFRGRGGEGSGGGKRDEEKPQRGAPARVSPVLLLETRSATVSST